MNKQTKIGVQVHCDFDQGSGKWFEDEHELTPDNVYARPDGNGRFCKTCARLRNERRATIRRSLGLKRRASFSADASDLPLAEFVQKYHPHLSIGVAP